MAGASTYPDAIDTDGNLVRVTVDTQVAGPADMNNKIDAIQSLEATVGAVASAPAGAPYAAFNCSLANLVGMKTTATRNIRRPYEAMTGILDGAAGSLPTGGSVVGGAELDWVSCYPYLRVTLPAALGTSGIRVPVSASGTVNECYGRGIIWGVCG